MSTNDKLPGDAVKDRYDAALKKGGGSLWKATQQLALSGFVKGMVITAGVVLAAMAFGAALGTTGGTLPALTVEKGFSAGAAKALTFLMKPLGLMTMALGGTVGMASDMRRSNARVRGTEAERLAKEYENARVLQQIRQQSVQPAAENTLELQAALGDNPGKFAEAELKRRAEKTQTQYRTV